MNETLIIAANASVAKIFSINLRGEAELKVIDKLAHPESRAKGRQLYSDRSGDFHPAEATMGIHAAHSNPKEDEWNKFAKQVADYIDKHQQQYKNIIICASPHFEGLLNKNIEKLIEKKIIKRITKDYTHLNSQELIDIIRESIKK